MKHHLPTIADLPHHNVDAALESSIVVTLGVALFEGSTSVALLELEFNELSIKFGLQLDCRFVLIGGCIQCFLCADKPFGALGVLVLAKR